MKNIFYSILIGSAFLFNMTSCEKEIEDHSVITYYVDLQLNGEKQMWVELNSQFEDPGFTATENGEDVASKVKVSGEVQIDKVGYYVLEYSAVNKDGFATSDVREVFVYDPTNVDDYSGTYIVEGKRTSSGTVEEFFDFEVKIEKMNPGFYEFSDFLGGYYSQGRGYGDDYNLTGYASISSDGVIGLYSYVTGFGDSASSIVGVIEVDGKIKMTVEYAGMTFEYTLTKTTQGD